MADDAEIGVGGSDDRGANPGALHIAMTASSAEAREYLRKQSVLADKQSRIADLQIDTLEKKDEFELSHLRFRRFSDYARFALEIAGGLVVLLIVCGLGTMVWSASQDRDLVVDAFSVPPDMAQTGMSGSVLAGRVLDRLGRMQADTVGTLQGAGSYRRNSSDEVRVEIPDTGVSLGELNRYLRAWLGNETHVAGDLVRTDKGLALTVRYGSEPGTTDEAGAGELNALVEKAAEHVYAAARPYRYVEYLIGKKRYPEALALVPELTAHGSVQDRALAYLSWGEIYGRQNDWYRGLDIVHEAVRLDPENPIVRAWLSSGEADVGHEEPAYDEAVATVDRWRGPAVAGFDLDEATLLPQLFTAYGDELNGDYSGALRAWRLLAVSGWAAYQPDDHAQDSASDHDLAQARRIAVAMPPKDHQGRASYSVPLTKMLIAWNAGDWSAAMHWGKSADDVMDQDGDLVAFRHLFLWPQWAYAEARGGGMADAEKLISQTPADCDICMRMRGRIAALKGNLAEAARDFAVVAARSPHIPYAETDWGQMLLAKGDLDGAMEKFRAANLIGPHFADPLEMWGETLIRQNHSDLALAKFEEADKHAPNWGRLHLKWGEALFFAGKADDARKQFGIAAGLDLTPSERSELAHARAAHG